MFSSIDFHFITHSGYYHKGAFPLVKCTSELDSQVFVSGLSSDIVNAVVGVDLPLLLRRKYMLSSN